MKILGIDPGYDRMGVAVIEKGDSKETLVFSGCVRTDAKLSLPERLVIVGQELQAVIKRYHPDQVAVEALYFAKNTTTALKVAEARGVIQYVIARAGIPITEYHPNAVKLAVTGYGGASKDAIASMIPRLIVTDEGKKIDDELDAIAIALTHSANVKTAYPQV